MMNSDNSIGNLRCNVSGANKLIRTNVRPCIKVGQTHHILFSSGVWMDSVWQLIGKSNTEEMGLSSCTRQLCTTADMNTQHLYYEKHVSNNYKTQEH